MRDFRRELEHLSIIQSTYQRLNLRSSLIEDMIEHQKRMKMMYSAPSMIIDQIRQQERMRESLINANFPDRIKDQIIFNEQLNASAALLSQAKFTLIESQKQKWDVINNIVQSKVSLFESVKYILNSSAIDTRAELIKSATRLCELNIIQRHEKVAESLLNHAVLYTDFVGRTAKLIKDENESNRITALGASLEIAKSQYTWSNSILSRLLISSPTINEYYIPGSLNLFPVQQKELLENAKNVDCNDKESYFECSLASTTAEIVAQIVDMIVACNEKEMLKNDNIFKPTTKLISAIKNLILIVPQDKISFGEFIDCLYFIFYEGTGDLNRIHENKKRYLNNDECEFIWSIKHLRNLWLRHDIEHGTKKDIEDKKKKLNDSLQWLGILSLPHNEQDFRKIHISILEKAFEFLKILLNKIDQSE